MKMMSGKVDFGLIRDASRIELVKLLDSVTGPKAIVWDQQLVGPFGLIGDFSFLKEHNVSKMFYISTSKLPFNEIPNLIFLTRPYLKNMDHINQQLRMEEVQPGPKKDYHIWFVPRISLLCEDRLQHHGVYGAFTTIKELPILMFRLESDLVSLELPLCYRDLQLDKDPSGLFHVARALMNIQGIFGIIPNVFGNGAAAKSVFDLIVRMRRELAGIEPQISPQINQLVLIDRSVDLISPLATQLTYEGLIDQFFEIKNCAVKLPADKFSSGRGENENLEYADMKTIPLTSSDKLYSTIRDCNFSAVGPKLSVEAKDVTAKFDKRKFATSVSEMKLFVQNLPEIQQAKECLAVQTTIAELVQSEIVNNSFRPALQAEQELLKGYETDRINPYIEESISRKDPLLKILRLICLQCVVNCGLKQKTFDFYKREIIQVYGYENFLTIENLENAGLLFLQKNKNNYSTIRKTLRLTVEDVNESKPSDISYVHSGYAPLSVRLIEYLQWPGWRAITQILHILPGPTLKETQQLPSALRQRRESGNSTHSSQGDASTCLVFFIGGCTYAELAALRFMSKIEQGGPEYIVATTKMINQNNFIESLMDNVTTAS